MVDLGPLLPWGINSQGQIVGEDPSANRAFLYTGVPGNGGTMADLGTLGGTKASAIAINDSGQIAGSSYILGDLTSHAFRYTGIPGNGGAMADLGTLVGTAYSTPPLSTLPETSLDAAATSPLKSIRAGTHLFTSALPGPEGR